MVLFVLNIFYAISSFQFESLIRRGHGVRGCNQRPRKGVILRDGLRFRGSSGEIGNARSFSSHPCRERPRVASGILGMFSSGCVFCVRLFVAGFPIPCVRSGAYVVEKFKWIGHMEYSLETTPYCAIFFHVVLYSGLLVYVFMWLASFSGSHTFFVYSPLTQIVRKLLYSFHCVEIKPAVIKKVFLKFFFVWHLGNTVARMWRLCLSILWMFLVSLSVCLSVFVSFTFFRFNGGRM